MSNQATDSAREVVPVKFFSGINDQDVPTFAEYLEAKKNGTTINRINGIHPSLLNDVPTDDDD